MVREVSGGVVLFFINEMFVLLEDINLIKEYIYCYLILLMVCSLEKS